MPTRNAQSFIYIDVFWLFSTFELFLHLVLNSILCALTQKGSVASVFCQAECLELIFHVVRYMHHFPIKISHSSFDRLSPLFLIYPINPVKGAALLSGSIKDLTFFVEKKNRQKRAHAPFFSPYF